MLIRVVKEGRKKQGNVFNDQIKVGIAVYFLIKNENKKDCKIYYNVIDDFVKSDAKIEYLRNNKFESLKFEEIIPDKNNNWINITDNDFDDLIPIGNKQTKFAKKKNEINCMFEFIYIRDS